MTVKTWQVISSIVLITTISVLLQIPNETWGTAATASLVLGASALACMATSCTLSSRWGFVEKLFGGLDQLYQTHKWLGIWALVFAVYHFVFKANLDSWDASPILELPKYWARLARQLSIVALGFIVLLALNRNIPYHVWRWWHKLSGPLFLIVILHWLSFKSPITLDSSAGIWLALICAIGVMAAFYKLVLYPLLASGGEYKVVAVSHGNKAVHLELAPVNRSFAFEAGQFGFLALKEAGLREPHPFTIASAPTNTGNIHFVIRALGDYTHKLSEQVKVGMVADVYAPHGHFKRMPDAQTEIWIGAGIGISPFISWLEDKSIGHFESATLVYCFDPSRAFPSVERIQEMAADSGVRFVPNPSDGDALAETIRRVATEVSPQQVQISFCGPKGLLKHVEELMKANNIPAKNIRYEFFEFR
ncbi:ferredoxin reductase family protein [uncultured Paraglaciecola sp.]|uniref:ferredoxin reductase family protein n=1 Tax=uncultured Paraglaciecola sp. TaxID=1765024 RepID=UPI0030DC1B15|tara:strand:- start:6804 stop:8063 length:1260 start_codon:yes stop_codon:yes gene_type:complete